MNKYDMARRDKLVKTLEKAKEQAEDAFVYLIAGGAPIEEATDMKLTIEQIEVTIERLKGMVNAT